MVCLPAAVAKPAEYSGRRLPVNPRGKRADKNRVLPLVEIAKTP